LLSYWEISRQPWEFIMGHHLASGTKIDCHADHWWHACEEYCQHTTHHHDNKPFEVAIHPTKAQVPLTIGICYDH
jgi:hypothetical protein